MEKQRLDKYYQKKINPYSKEIDYTDNSKTLFNKYKKF